MADEYVLRHAEVATLGQVSREGQQRGSFSFTSNKSVSHESTQSAVRNVLNGQSDPPKVSHSCKDKGH